MNVTQRKYTLERLNTQLATKVNAILAENDLIVEANNSAYVITFEELEEILKTHPQLVSLKQYTNNTCQGYFEINATEIRKILNKPTTILSSSKVSYVDYKNSLFQKVIRVNANCKCLINEYADRIIKLQSRAQYAKDQVMLGDAKEALAALEEFNSLVF